MRKALGVCGWPPAPTRHPRHVGTGDLGRTDPLLPAVRPGPASAPSRETIRDVQLETGVVGYLATTPPGRPRPGRAWYGAAVARPCGRRGVGGLPGSSRPCGT